MMIGVNRSVIVRTVVTIHIILFLLFFLIDKNTFSKTALGKFYQSKIIIGPFFREDRIRSAPHVLMRYHISSGWSDWMDIGMNYKRKYEAGIWNYGSIMKSEYTLYLGQNLAHIVRNDSLNQSAVDNRYFRALHRFIEDEKLLNNKADSVQLMYVRKHIDADKIFEMDTVWQIVYDVRPMHDRLFK